MHYQARWSIVMSMLVILLLRFPLPYSFKDTIFVFIGHRRGFSIFIL